MTSAAAANKHSIKRWRSFEVNIWPDHDAAFCDAWFCVDTNRHHSVTTGFTAFRLVTSSNCCPGKNFGDTHEISRSDLFGYNQTNRLRIHGRSECFSQVLDRGFVYNVQSVRFDKATLASPC